MPRFFSFAQARELLPRVAQLIQQAVENKSRYEGAERWRQDFIRRIMMMGGLVVDRAPVERNRQQQNHAAERLKSAVEEVHGLGVLIKDLDVGLIDFPTLLNGSEVYLCWKLGEDDLRFWHGIQEGFAGRKEIDDEFLSNHRGRVD